MALKIHGDHFSNTYTAAQGGVLHPLPDTVVNIDGRSMYRINRYDQMDPFLMSLVSESDLWMYISSYGGLTAGRIDEEHSLFPYVTDDLLHKSHGITGPVTWLRVSRGNYDETTWTPFRQFPGEAGIERNCYKTLLSDCIVFEEINHNLGLTFRYSWTSADRFGFIRKATLTNRTSSEDMSVQVLDGLANLLPAEVGLWMQQKQSCLLDAYTRSELAAGHRLAIISLTAQIVDSSEPVEALSASVVWSDGLPNAVPLLGLSQLPAFLLGQKLHPEYLSTGKRGAFFVSSSLDLTAGESVSWHLIADTNRSQSDIQDLLSLLRSGCSIVEILRQAETAAGASLLRLAASADALQATGNQPASAHFNIMRGGVSPDGYFIDARDFCDFVAKRNKAALRQAKSLLEDLPGRLPLNELVKRFSNESLPPDLHRLALEYIPLTFSRRHGDPSRPWNRFSIHVKANDGTPILNYQGNWRDIFQNWEALSASFPGLLPHMIAKFVNASTPDGYNPYRISRAGFDWETPEPEDPWSNIGYWGDHQIVYLLSLLEAQERIDAAGLIDMMTRPIFSYGDVPYRIKPFDALFEDAKHTIDYDEPAAKRAFERAERIGSDGLLLTGADGKVYHVTLAEKMIVSVLAKLGNFVMDGGIWMNTQRPEWNDANNALVGNGLSVVTLCYLRRYLAFFASTLERTTSEKLNLSIEVNRWLIETSRILMRHTGLLELRAISDDERCVLLKELAETASRYRQFVYSNGLTAGGQTDKRDIMQLCETALKFVDHSIHANRRSDGLVHSYNLLNLNHPGSARIERLYEMLEGQAAVLSSGVLTSRECVELLDALFKSRLYRSDLETFILYPERELPGFMERGVLPPDLTAQIPLLGRMLQAKDDTLVKADAKAVVRFASALTSSGALKSVLDSLENTEWADDAKRDRLSILSAYESVFNHASFTGRSGTMYGYEGIGCTYWHMVSKLMLAAQECARRAYESNDDPLIVALLVKQYYRIHDGLGFMKSSRLFGAFPPDPYSHTPAQGGAKQPGMTGQTKEDILARWGELGVIVKNGCLIFDPFLLRRDEFLAQRRTWTYIDERGIEETISIPPRSLGFTYCQIPVIYTESEGPAFRIVTLFRNGSVQSREGAALTQEESESIFGRRGEIDRIEVMIDSRKVIV
jgi:hypothetical protein